MLDVALILPIQIIVNGLLSIRVSQMSWCSFCVDLNSLTIIKRINNSEKVDALENWRELKLFSPAEAAGIVQEKVKKTGEKDAGIKEKQNQSIGIDAVDPARHRCRCISLSSLSYQAINDPSYKRVQSQ